MVHYMAHTPRSFPSSLPIQVQLWQRWCLAELSHFIYIYIFIDCHLFRILTRGGKENISDWGHVNENNQI